MMTVESLVVVAHKFIPSTQKVALGVQANLVYKVGPRPANPLTKNREDPPLLPLLHLLKILFEVAKIA